MTNTTFQFWLQVDPDQGDFSDDSALNSICLVCNDDDATEICSKRGFWGKWGQSQVCSQGFISAAFKWEANQHASDDTAGNDLALYCNDATETEFRVHGVSIPGWGNWENSQGAWRVKQHCWLFTRICGIQTRVEEKQGYSKDDSALNGVRLKCCNE